MDNTSDFKIPGDPLQTLRSMADAGVGACAALVSHTTEPFRETLQSIMLEALRQLNMPSRKDVLNLRARLDNIEAQLEEINAKLDGLKHNERPRRKARARNERT